MKVLLDYDASTKMLYQNGVYVSTSVCSVNLVDFNEANDISIAEVIKLKDAGFTTGEIVILAKEKVI